MGGNREGISCSFNVNALEENGTETPSATTFGLVFWVFSVPAYLVR